MRQWWTTVRRAVQGGTWSIGARLNLGFGLVLGLMVVVGGLAWMQFVQQDHRLRHLADTDVQRTALAQQMQLAVKDMVVSLANLCLLEEAADQADERQAFQAAMTRYDGARKALDRSLAGDGSQRLREAMRQVAAAEDGAVPIFTKMAAFDGSIDRAVQADFYYTQVGGPQRAWQQGLRELEASMSQAMAAAVEASHAASTRVQAVIGGLLGAALAVGLVASWRIRRGITRPLGDAVAVARAVAAGHLAVQVQAARGDEIGALLQALAEMQAGLRRLVGDIRACADSIQTASDEVAGGNADLSQRTELAAGRLQQTVSSLDGLTGAVRQSADSAATANRLAGSASGAASRGGEVVQQVVSNMHEISAASRKIADITSVIDGIAFQTNLLALNAAVEAARAGEQGRGFAVVAGEVRTLAQRAAEAAQQIKGLIGDSVERVDAGTALVREAGGSMGEIVSAVQRVTGVIGSITAATAEQSHGLGEVNGAVVQLDQMTQQNAALVEQSAAAAESLRDQARRLNQLVGAFRLDD
jgi:methyl-accepting chemotaxis protein